MAAKTRKPKPKAAKKVVKKAAPAKKSSVKKVRCAGKTQDGRKCARMVVLPAKFCYLHKKSR